MANSTITPSLIAAESVMWLDNELVMAANVFRGYREDFALRPNGYKPGESISIRVPTNFTVRTNATMAPQDVIEGKRTLTLDRRVGVDFEFTSQELTLSISELSERVIRPAMVQIANKIDQDLHDLYKRVNNWVGTPGQTVNSFSDFALAPERLDMLAVPRDSRVGVLSPRDHWGLVGSQTTLFNNSINQEAFRRGETGNVAGVNLFMSQNVATHTTGNFATSGLTVGSGAYANYSAVKDTLIASITINGTANGQTLKAGDVFTIADVFDVNPVTRARLPHLKQFTVVNDVTITGTSVTFDYYPAAINSGAFKTVDGPANNMNGKAVTFLGAPNTNYPQNLVFHPNAFALVMVPMEAPPGAVDVARRTYKGTSVRVIPVYDGTNDKSAWRLDVLYGVLAVDPRLAVRLSGSP